jgi:DNA-binding NarL/FixJ family response regulator
MTSIRVLIVDRQALFRESLSAVLAAQDAFVVVGDAGDAAAAARLAAERAPVVIITDLYLPDACGAAVVARLRAAQADARIIALTALADEETVAAAVVAGVQGYVLKSQPAAELMQAIRTVAQGGAALDPLVVPVIWRRFAQLIQREECAADRPEALSPTECDVLRLLARGQTTRQIADALSAPPAAVEKAVAEACEKLHARNRTEAAVIALKRGLISAH